MDTLTGKVGCVCASTCVCGATCVCPCHAALLIPLLSLKVEESRTELERVVQECERSRVEHEQQISDLASTLQMYQVCIRT